METFLLFLYTAVVSVLIAFLLGKLFTDDAAAAAGEADLGPEGSAQGSDEVEKASAEVGESSVARDGGGVVKEEAVVDHVILHDEKKFVKNEAVLEDVLLPHDEEKVLKEAVLEREEKGAEDDEVVGGVVEDKSTTDVEAEERVAVEADERVKEEEGGDEAGSLLQEEDGWEGIEKSGIEKLFGVAIGYVGGEKGAEEVAKLSSDVQMKLYGLYKVATEGPCYEAQPMALKVASRAKWHAWQRLGGMNPEAAMEQYISLLNDNIPGWMRETPRANVDPKNEASDSRSSEDSSYPEGGTDHGTAGSKFKQGLTTAMLFNLISPSRVAWLTIW